MSPANRAVLPTVGDMLATCTHNLPDHEPIVQPGRIGLQPAPTASDFRTAILKAQLVNYWTDTDPAALFAAGVLTCAITEWDSIGQQGKKQPRLVLDLREMAKAAEKDKAKEAREEVLTLAAVRYFEEGLTKSGWVAINGRLPTSPATDSDVSSNGSESEPVITKGPRELRKIKAGRVKKSTNTSQAATSKKFSSIRPKPIEIEASSKYSMFEEIPDTPRTPGTADTVKLSLRSAAKAAAARNAVIAAADIAALAARKKAAKKTKRLDKDVAMRDVQMN